MQPAAPQQCLPEQPPPPTHGNRGRVYVGWGPVALMRTPSALTAVLTIWKGKSCTTLPVTLQLATPLTKGQETSMGVQVLCSRRRLSSCLHSCSLHVAQGPPTGAAHWRMAGLLVLGVTAGALRQGRGGGCGG